MSLRRAVIAQLKNHVTAIGGRVYQAYLAPADVQTPYATVKMAGVRGDVTLLYAGDQSIEVYVYRDHDCFVSLDALKQLAVLALNGSVLVTESGERHHIRWVPFGQGDFVDEERKLIGCVESFETTVIHERR
ncbi:MAG: hypothetical protein ACLKAK_07295 [Alkaliphilus sp.]